MTVNFSQLSLTFVLIRRVIVAYMSSNNYQGLHNSLIENYILAMLIAAYDHILFSSIRKQLLSSESTESLGLGTM